MKKTLILVSEKRYFWSYTKNCKFYDVECACIKDFWFPKSIRRKLPELNYLRPVILGQWKKRIEDYDKVIVLDSSYSWKIGKLLSRQCFSKGIYFVYWNKIHPDYKIAVRQQKIINKDIKKYSYNFTDCRKYSMDFNPLPYVPADLNKISKIFPGLSESDILFVGADKKNRIKELDKLCEKLNQMNISYFIYMYSSQKQTRAKNFEVYQESISYENYLAMVNKTKAILDIDAFVEEAYSLRVYEALFYSKKYITINQNILCEKFYSPSNIFVIGHDDIDSLNKFLNLPYEQLDEDTVNYYNVENWVDRFCKHS